MLGQWICNALCQKGLGRTHRMLMHSVEDLVVFSCFGFLNPLHSPVSSMRRIDIWPLITLPGQCEPYYPARVWECFKSPAPEKRS